MARGKTRSKRSLDESKNHKPPSLTPISETLISAIRASEGIKLPFLKILYGHVVRLSLNKSISGSDGEDHSYCLGSLFELCGFVTSFEGCDSLGEFLFKELEFRFEMIFSALCDVSANREKGHALLISETLASFDGLTTLLRCCMVVLTLAEPNLVVEKTQVLLRILGRVISSLSEGDNKDLVTFEKRNSRELSCRDTASTASVHEGFIDLSSNLKPSDPWRPFLYAVFEVFADELLMHRLLREYFVRAVAASSTNGSLFHRHFRTGDLGILLEVISLHFILSFSDEEAYQNFLNRLSCRSCNDLRVSEVSLTSSLSLLLNPIILSAPKILQVHLILLVSDTIGVSMSAESIRPNMRLIGGSYLRTFEMSVLLYTVFMSTFLTEGHPIGRKTSSLNPGIFERSSEPAFECHIQEVTQSKMDYLVARLVSLWNSQRSKVYDETKSNLLDDSIVCIDESRVDESCKNDIVSILNSIVLGAFSDSLSHVGLYKKGEARPQDIYLWAAVLKLMSSSMSAVIWCLRHDDEDLVCLEEASSCKAYDFLVNIIGCFQHFNVSLPYQKKLFDMMETNLIRHKSTKWMLVHISGLLSLSFASGFDFLVENCVSTLVALMNLYAFEEGNVGALRSLIVPGSKSFSPQEPLHKPELVTVDQKSCQKIASRIQKIQSLFLSSEIRSRAETTSCSAFILKCSREETEETCNGKVFLDCLNSPDYDGLADFVECKAGKDYSSWLKEKERHRKWRYKKMAVLRLKKRKKAWKLAVAKKF